MIRDFIKRHRKADAMVLLIVVLLLAGVGYVGNRDLPGTVWLPDVSKVSDEKVLFNAPVKSEGVLTSYGHAVKYTTTDGWSPIYKDSKEWTTIYEFETNGRLKPSECPNIMKIEEVLSQGCDKAGDFNGSPVYSISRRLPSGTVEYFVNVGDTFIYIKRNGDGLASLDYLKTFKPMPRRDADTKYLGANKDLVKAVFDKRGADKAVEDRKNSAAYTKLDFTPVLAGKLPNGWKAHKNQPNKVMIDGPDPDHPKMFETSYVNKANDDESVSWYVFKLADSRVGKTCGPTPGEGMDFLACERVPGKDYYEYEKYNSSQSFSRYLYRPIGDALIIAKIYLPEKDGRPPVYPTALAKTQEELILNAKAVDKNQLKGSKFDNLRY